MNVSKINQELGNADLYLIDQILKNRFSKGMKILDAGCGEGRNLSYFIKNNFDVTGIDKDASSIRMLKFMAKNLNPDFDTSVFTVQSIEFNELTNCSFDVLLCYSVLHFSRNQKHFLELIGYMVQLVKPGGSLLISMESDYMMGQDKKGEQNKTSLNPNGDLRFLLNKSLVNQILTIFPLELSEPIRYEVIADMRSMAYLIMKKTSL